MVKHIFFRFALDRFPRISMSDKTKTVMHNIDRQTMPVLPAPRKPQWDS